MTQQTRAHHTPHLTRRRFAGLTAAALGAATLPAASSTPAVAQSMDPFTYIITMTETETLGQVAGQPVDEVGPVEADGIQWTAMIQVPIKRGQDLHYTCEFDSAWSIMMAYGMDVPLQEQLDAVGFDTRLEPYWEDQGSVVMIYGGDIGEHFCGDLNNNLVAKAKGSAMRKAFEAQGLVATPVHDRPAIEQAINSGYPVFFKSTVDFLDWRPAIWNTPEGIQYQVVFSNDHALTVIGYNDTEVVIRDPLGPTSTNAQRPFQYRVSWERFLQVFAAQENDGLAVSPPGTSLTSGDETGESTELAAANATGDQQALSTAQQVPSPTPTASLGFASGDQVRVGGDPLNLRSEATTDGDIVVELAPGTLIEITGAPVESGSNTWYPIEVVYSGQAGYVVRDYLVPVDD